MFPERFTEHRQATNNPNHSNASAAVPTHFNLLVHLIADIRVMPLELQSSKNTAHRKAREVYLIESGRRNEH